jgi:hypothetical protein
MQQENGVTIPTWEHLPRQNRNSRDRHVYVIEFDLGSVKPGQTSDPRSRMRQHWEDAARFGGRITRWWMSPAHSAWADNEAVLLNTAREHGRWLIGEYFADLDYSVLHNMAMTLDYTPSPATPLTDERTPAEWRRHSRQRQVQEMRAMGFGIRSIAQRLGVGVGTVHKDVRDLETAGNA